MSLVLVVEDDDGARRAMEDFLTDEGYDVVLATDGRHAIEQLAQHRPSVLLTDLEMARLDGEQLIAHAKAHHPELPIVVLTSCLVVDAQRETERLGVFGYLNKPIELEALLAQVTMAIAG